MWTPIHPNMNLSTDEIENATSWGNCSFIMTSPSRVYQIIDLHIYKLLIDKNSALMSFNAFANCEQSYFELTFHRMDAIVHQAKIYSSKRNSLFFSLAQFTIFRSNKPSHIEKKHHHVSIRRSQLSGTDIHTSYYDLFRCQNS